MGSFRTDGKAVNVVLDYDVTKNSPVVAQGWAGFALADGDSGDTIAIEVEREHEFTVDGAVTADVGDILYIAADGTVSGTDTGIPFVKVTVAKDANNVVAGKLLSQLS